MMRRRSNLLAALRLTTAVIALGLGLCVTAACGRGGTPPEAAKAGKDAHDDDRADDKTKAGESSGEKEGEHAEEGGVELSEEAFKRAGIEVGEVKAVDASSVLLAPADLEPNADKLARVGPRVSGRIARIAVSLGATVKAGQALATIRSPEAAEAVAALDGAKAAGTLAETTLARERDLFERKISARREVLEAEAGLATSQAAVRAAEARLAAMGFARGGNAANVEPVVTVTSPIAGTVIERTAAADAPVQPDSVLFTIADLRSLWLTVKVPESNAPQVRRGQRVQIEVRALPGTPIAGAIDYVAPPVDASTRTVDVRLSVPNPQGALRPGMSATARFEISAPASQDAPSKPRASRTSASTARVLVPRAAVQELNQANVVFVTTDEERRFEPKPVTVGASYGPDVEILSGLNPGDRIVVRGAFTLKAQAVRGAAAHDDH